MCDVPNTGSFTMVHSACTCCCSLPKAHPWPPFAGKGTQLRISGDEGNITDAKMKSIDREVPDALRRDVCYLFFDVKCAFDWSVSRRRWIREGTKIANELAAFTGKGKTADLIMACSDLLDYAKTQTEKEAGFLKDIRLARTKRTARRTGKGSLPEDP